MPSLWLGVSLFCISYTQSIRIELNLPPKHPTHWCLSFYCTAIVLVQVLIPLASTHCLPTGFPVPILALLQTISHIEHIDVFLLYEVITLLTRCEQPSQGPARSDPTSRFTLISCQTPLT